MRKLAHLFALVVLMFALCSCSAASISQDAEDAVKSYNNIITTLKDCNSNPAGCDKTKVWDAMDSQTKVLYRDAYNALVRIDRIIETYFDPIEHQYMKAKTGTDILKLASINSYVDLFVYLFKPDKLVFDENTISGLEPESDSVITKSQIIIQTHQASQKFMMIREDDGVWRTSSFQDASAIALNPIFLSEAAMKEYAQGNLEAELKRRDAVRAYFAEELQKRREHGM